MRKSELHLISDNGDTVAPKIAAAVEAAYRWSLSMSMFPNIDPALLANAAERLAQNMKQIRGS
jgi:hypothetical protein